MTNSIFAFEQKNYLKIIINEMQIKNQIIKFFSKEMEKLNLFRQNWKIFTVKNYNF